MSFGVLVGTDAVNAVHGQQLVTIIRILYTVVARSNESIHFFMQL